MTRGFANTNYSSPVSTGSNWLCLCFYALTTSSAPHSVSQTGAVTRAKKLIEHSLLNCCSVECGVEGCAALKWLLRHYIACVEPACKVCQPVTHCLQRARDISELEHVSFGTSSRSCSSPAVPTAAQGSSYGNSSSSSNTCSSNSSSSGAIDGRALAETSAIDTLGRCAAAGALTDSEVAIEAALLDDDADSACQIIGAASDAVVASDAEVHVMGPVSDDFDRRAATAAAAEDRVVVLAGMLLHGLMTKPSMDGAVLGGEEARAVSAHVKQLWLHLLSGQCTWPDDDTAAASPAANAVADSKAASALGDYTSPQHQSTAAAGGADAGGVAAASMKNPGCCGSTSCLGARKVLGHLLGCKEPSCRVCQRVKSKFSSRRKTGRSGAAGAATDAASTGTGAEDTIVAFQEDLHQMFSRLRT